MEQSIPDNHPQQRYTGRLRLIAAGTHLSGLITWAVGPLVILWLARSRQLQEHAKRAINWQLTFGLGIYIAGILLAVAFLLSDFRPAVWGPMLALILIGGNLLFCTVAAVYAAKGTLWTYPVALKIKETPSVSRTF